MNFGQAIEALKERKKVSRAGWNGKGMWLKYIGRENYTLHDAEICRLLDDALPWIGMRTADNMFVPWLASQTDILAEDWGIVE